MLMTACASPTLIGAVRDAAARQLHRPIQVRCPHPTLLPGQSMRCSARAPDTEITVDVTRAAAHRVVVSPTVAVLSRSAVEAGAVAYLRSVQRVDASINCGPNPVMIASRAGAVDCTATALGRTHVVVATLVGATLQFTLR